MKRFEMSESNDLENKIELYGEFNGTDFTNESSLKSFLKEFSETFRAADLSLRIFDIIPDLITKLTETSTVAKKSIIEELLWVIFGDVDNYLPFGVAPEALIQQEIQKIYKFYQEKETKGEKLGFSESNYGINAIHFKRGLLGQKYLNDNIHLLYPLSKDSNPEIRLWCIYLMSWLRVTALDNQKQLRICLESEEVEYIKASIIIALGFTQFYLDDQALLPIFHQYFNSSSALIKASAAIAIFTSTKASPPEEIVTFLSSFREKSDNFFKDDHDVQKLPWMEYNLESYLELCYIELSSDVKQNFFPQLLQDLFNPKLDNFKLFQQLYSIAFPQKYSSKSKLTEKQKKLICASMFFLPMVWTSVDYRTILDHVNLPWRNYSELQLFFNNQGLIPDFFDFLEFLGQNDEKKILNLGNQHGWKIIEDHDQLNWDNSQSYDMAGLIGKWMVQKGEKVNNLMIQAYGMDLWACALSFSNEASKLKQAMELFEKAKNINPEWYSPEYLQKTKEKLH